MKFERTQYQSPEMSILEILTQDILTVSGENELEPDVNN